MINQPPVQPSVKKRFALSTAKIILVLVGVAAIGALVYVSYKYNAPQIITNAVPKQGSTFDLQLPDWRVQLPITEDLKTMLVSKSIDENGYQEILLVTPELDKVWTCPTDGDGNKGTIGFLTKQPLDSNSIVGLTKKPAQATVTIKNDKYIYWADLPQSCTTDPSYSKLVSDFKAGFLKLRAY
jgi:hypothetical protein